MSQHLFQRVLLVEDNESHALLIKRALKEFCNEVFLATSVSAATTHLGQGTVDLIVTDLNLPDSKGVSHVESFKAIQSTTPIIVLTSSTSLEDAVEAMKLGARDFLVKSFEGQFRDAISLSLSRVYQTLVLERERRKFEGEMLLLRGAIENSQDGLAVVDSDGNLQWANSAFFALIARCGGDGKSIITIATDRVNKADVLRASIRRNLSALPNGASWNTEITFTDSKDQAFDLSLSCVGDSSDEPPAGSKRFVAWARNISELKRRERFQREILSTTTHDLKGPLGAIILSSELLGDMLKDDEKSRQLALRIASSAQSSVNLIDEFLSARRLQEGTFILRPKEQKIVNTIQEVLEGFKSIVAARGIELVFSCSDNNLLARVDTLGFTRVLGNLLGNAAKFTNRGGKITVVADNEGEDFRVSVVDTGSGMEPSDVQKIFDRFSRLSRHDEIAGTGLGLFVVKSIVNAHGGKIEVQSKVGEGTTFAITFPVNPPVNDRGELISLDFA